jgi:hypothetical protein
MRQLYRKPLQSVIHILINQMEICECGMGLPGLTPEQFVVRKVLKERLVRQEFKVHKEL